MASYKITKKEIEEMSSVEILKNFEICCVSGVHETYSTKGISKVTNKSRDLLLNALLDRLKSDQTYDNNFNIINRD